MGYIEKYLTLKSKMKKKQKKLISKIAVCIFYILFYTALVKLGFFILISCMLFWAYLISIPRFEHLVPLVTIMMKFIHFYLFVLIFAGEFYLISIISKWVKGK